MKLTLSELSVGKPIPRLDGALKVTGGARYAADFNQRGQAYAVIVQSPISLGRISSLDTSPVAQLSGVIAVISHLNAPKLPYNPHRTYLDPVGERLHVLQDDRVHFFGQPIAVVIAHELNCAEHAACLLNVSYESERAVVDLESPAAEPIAPQAGLTPDSRLPADRARGDAEALSDAAVRIDASYEIARENHNPMEPHATIASWDGDHLTLWSKTQNLSGEAEEIAAIFGIPPANVQVINPFIGGAFGTALRPWPHVTLAAIAARYVNRPVKLVLTRRQMFSATGYRPRTTQHVSIGAETDGRCTAIVHEAVAETSRYEEYVEAVVTPTRFMYSCANVRTRYRIVPLDVSTPTFMRGPGQASGVHALECAMDEMAAKLDMDPIEFRLRNEPSVDEDFNRPFSTRSLRECFKAGAERFGWKDRDARAGFMRDGRLLIGWGVAAGTYPAAFREAFARVRLLAGEIAEVEVGASDMGPGTYTSLAQVAADALELPVTSVRVSLGRSDFPTGPAHGGSMTMASFGSAVHAAALAVREQISAGKSAPLEAVASSAPGDERNRFSFHGFGAIFAEVAIDPDVSTIQVRRVVGTYAAGRIINAKLAKSQALGGIVGGIGMALMERTIIDPRDGRLVNAHMADYLVPVNLDIQDLDVTFVDEEDPYVNPIGAKGIGELTYIGVSPAIANAVFHATGKRIRHLPIRIEDVLQ